MEAIPLGNICIVQVFNPDLVYQCRPRVHADVAIPAQEFCTHLRGLAGFRRMPLLEIARKSRAGRETVSCCMRAKSSTSNLWPLVSISTMRLYRLGGAHA